MLINENGVSLGNDENVLELVVMVTHSVNTLNCTL